MLEGTANNAQRKSRRKEKMATIHPPSFAEEMAEVLHPPVQG